MPRLTRTRVSLAVALGLALCGCSDEDARSELNTEGPPRVIEVNVLSESELDAVFLGTTPNFFFGELATYCSDDPDEKINLRYCHEDQALVTDAEPLAWYGRLVVNELLIGDKIEDLDEIGTDENGNPIYEGSIARSQPAVLNCGGTEVPYDGYYDPTGSHLTDPPGPSIVIEPLDPYVGTDVECEVSLRPEVIQDKEFLSADPARSGPFTFRTAKMTIDTFFGDPAWVYAGDDPFNLFTDDSEDVALDVTLAVVFNAVVDDGSLTPGVVELLDGDDNPVAITLSASFTDVIITPDAPLDPETTYTLRVSGGITEAFGGMFDPAEPFELTFTTRAGA